MHNIVAGLVSDVNIPVDPAGLPGGAVLDGLIGGAKAFGLSLCVLAVVLGAIAIGLGRQFANHQATDKGKMAVFGGLGAALLIAAVDVLVNFATSAGGRV